MSQAIAPPPPTKDFFISYTGQDRTWAEWIAWVLEEAGYTVVIQAWDFRPGGNFVLDMQQATMQANRTIAVLSSLYLDKPFPQPEWAAAFAQDPTSRDRKLIPVRIENCAPPGLLAQIVYIDVFDCNEPEAQQRLLSAVTDGRMKPSQRPRFPGKEGDRIPFPGHASPSSPDAINRVSTPSPSSPSSSTPTHPSTHPPLHPSTPLPSLSTYDSTTWVGREQLIADLTQKLRDGYRILAITGITGIGKTALAERLVVEVSGNGIPFHRLNFDDRGQGRDFLSGALTLLPKLGETVTTEDQKDPQNALRHLLNALRHQPFLVQIDSLEMLLQGDEQTGWNEFTDPLWVDFFQQLLAGDVCQSQLLLTSQALPEELEMEAARYPRGWHRQDLGGLTETEQLQLFEKYGLKPDGLDAEVLQRFVDLYQGHPLVLQVIARDILDKPFNGNVQQYWQRYQAEFNQLDSDAKQKGNSPRALQLRVKQRVEQALNRLPADARQMLCRSSVYRRPVPEEFWLAMMKELPEDQQWAALELLKSHNLAEQELRGDGLLFLSQHNIIRGVARRLLKTDKETWDKTERLAVQVWLNDYEVESDAPKLEKIRGKLEAFYHHCEGEDWAAARRILIDQGVGKQLHNWGYFIEELNLYGHLLGQLENDTNLTCEIAIGDAHWSLSNYPKAIKHFQQALIFVRKLNDSASEGVLLGRLGGVYISLGDYPKAIDYQKRYLTSSRVVGDRQKEGHALGCLGAVCLSLGNYFQAIEYSRQYLAIACETGDQYGEGKALSGLSIAYQALGNSSQALEYSQQSLRIAREIGYRRGEGIAVGTMGNAYYSLGSYLQAIDCHQQNLAIAHEIGYRRGEGIAMRNLGNAYCTLGEYSQASEFYKQSLAIACEIGDRQGESTTLVSWGGMLIKLGQNLQAYQHLQSSLRGFEELGDRSGEAEALLRLGELHYKTGEIEQAREYCDRALAIASELGIPLVKECEGLREKLRLEPSP